MSPCRRLYNELFLPWTYNHPHEESTFPGFSETLTSAPAEVKNASSRAPYLVRELELSMKSGILYALDNFLWLDIVDPAQFQKFNEIYSALSSLELGHKRLWFPKGSGDLRLGHGGRQPYFPQDLKQPSIFAGVEGFLQADGLLPTNHLAS